MEVIVLKLKQHYNNWNDFCNTAHTFSSQICDYLTEGFPYDVFFDKSFLVSSQYPINERKTLEGLLEKEFQMVNIGEYIFQWDRSEFQYGKHFLVDLVDTQVSFLIFSDNVKKKFIIMVTD
ncbi:hypothetical protein ABH948_002384 [Bacillus sp. RC218]|uniref:hypothetical protein n=1 Tax=Bacillus sp. RC218 TaxID=3156282 RepID=UPI0038338D1D